MRTIRTIGQPLRRLLALLFLAAALSGCAHVQLVAGYDATTDQELTALYADTTAFVAKMGTVAGTPAGTYAANTDFYDQSEGRVAVLVARAEALRVRNSCPTTQLMTRALDVAGIPADLRSRIGSPPEGECDVVLMRLIQDQFHDLRKFHQAMGDKGIPTVAAGPLLEGGLGASIRAAMAVQLAKKAQ